MLRTCMVQLAKNATPILTNNATRAFATSGVRFAKLKNPPPESFTKMLQEAEKQAQPGPQPIGVTTERGVVTEDPGVTELEAEETITKKYVEFFENVENDGWLARNAMNELMQHAFVPEPEVSIAVLHSCRRMNDYALAVRYLESLKHLLEPKVKDIWPWYYQEIESTLRELGVEAPEDIGYDKPEYFLPNVEDIHGFPDRSGWEKVHADKRAELNRIVEEMDTIAARTEAFIKQGKTA